MLLGLAFPFFLMFVGIYLIFKVSRAGMFQNDQKLAKLFYSFTKYMLSFILLNLPYFLTLLISIFITVSVEKLKWLRWTVQLTSLLSCSIPLILSIDLNILTHIYRYKSKKKTLPTAVLYIDPHWVLLQTLIYHYKLA